MSSSIDDIWAELQAETAPKPKRKQAPRIAVSDIARASRASKVKPAEAAAAAEAVGPSAKRPLQLSDGSDESLESWARPIRRDINRMTDGDRAERLAALKLVQKAVTGQDAPSGPLAHRVYHELLNRPLLRVVSDQNEKCREAAAATLLIAARAAGDTGAALALTIPVANCRLNYEVGKLGGATHVPLESAEEVRLSLSQLMQCTVQQCSGQPILLPHVPEVLSILLRTLHDPYHEVRKVATQLLVSLASLQPDIVQLHSAQLVKALQPSLAHQHAKMRGMALTALLKISCCGRAPAIVYDPTEVLHLVLGLCHDRASAVREQLVECLKEWIQLRASIAGGAEHAATALLKASLTLMGDDITKISTAAYQVVQYAGGLFIDSFGQKPSDPEVAACSELSAVATIAEQELQANCLPMQPAAPSLHMTASRAPRSDIVLPVYKAPFEGKPSDGTVALVQAHLNQLLSGVLTELAEWTETSRMGAVKLLYSVLVLAEEQIVAQANQLLVSLCQAVYAGSGQMKAQVLSCASVCGHFVSASVSLPIVLTQMKHDAGAVEVATELVLAATVQQQPVESKLLTKLSFTMSELLHDEQLQVAQLQGLVSLAAALIGCQVGSAEMPMLVSLLAHLGVLVRDCSSEEGGAQLLLELERAEASLANSAAAESVEALYVQYSSEVIVQATRGGSGHWSSKSLPWRVFQLVLVRGGPLVLQQNEHSRATMLSCMEISRDACLRAQALRQLQQLIAHPHSAQWEAPLVEQLLLNGLVPNAVWRAGKSAAGVRMAALEAIRQLLSCGVQKHTSQWEQAVQEPTHALLPLLLSALEDDEGKARLLACNVLEALLVGLPPQTFVYDQVRATIPEIIKRLDDARDEVRHAALGVIRALAAVIEHLKVGSYVEYVTAGLLLYLDDATLQRNVISTLERYAAADPEAFEKEIDKNVKRGVAPKICAQLLEVARAQTSNPCAIEPRN